MDEPKDPFYCQQSVYTVITFSHAKCFKSPSLERGAEGAQRGERGGAVLLQYSTEALKLG